MMASTSQSEFVLFHTRFDGSGFEGWKAGMHDALTQLGQVLPLQGIGARPKSMTDDEWEDLDELACSTIRLHLGHSVYSMVLDACTARDTWQGLCDAFSTDESREEPTFSRRSRRHRDCVCWHCGHTGHIQRRCFRRMRQRRRVMRDAIVVLTSGEDVVADYASDGDVTLSSSLSPEDLMSFDGALLSSWLLDEGATFHVTSRREWFRSFSSRRLGCVHLTDGSAYDIEGAGDVCLSLPSGASYTLRHVRYVPGLSQSLISVRQLQDSGCHVVLGEHSFQMHCGSLVIARGAWSGLTYLMHVSEVRDGMVSITLQPCRERQTTRHVTFADGLQDAQTLVKHLELVVQDTSMLHRHVERDCSSEPQLEAVRTSFHRHVEQLCFCDAHQDESAGVMTGMYDLSAEDLAVIQSFIDMLMSDELQDAQTLVEHVEPVVPGTSMHR